VDEAGELDVRDVAGGGKDAFKVPDGLGSAERVGLSGLLLWCCEGCGLFRR